MTTAAVTSYDIKDTGMHVAVEAFSSNTDGSQSMGTFIVPKQLVRPLVTALMESMLLPEPTVLGYRVKLTKYDDVNIATRYIREDGTGDWTWSPKGPLLSVEDKNKMLADIKAFRDEFPLDDSGYEPPWKMSDVKVVKVVKR